MTHVTRFGILISRANPPYDDIQKDTGWSKINDDKLQVTIHYEVVDLGEYGYSPLAFRNANSNPVYVYSERYVLLQTHVFENIHETEDINDLEFYQMLHGHPTGSGSLTAKATYETTAFADQLANYTPYDPNHQTGNFRYDITLWNVEAPYGQPYHIDYMSFNSTIEPNDFGLEQFTNSSSGMAEDIIEDRNLNGLTELSANEIAGAMMWNIGDIEPGQKKSITLALMYGSINNPYPTILTKTNADPNDECVQPWNMIDENYLTFDVCYDANGYVLDDVVITDYLPIEVDYYSSDPCGTYDSNTHTVTWDIGYLSGSDVNCIELVTKVNYYARPGGEFSNFVQMQCSEGICAATTTDVNVCYDGYGMSIIYVDKDANGFNNGTTWDNAYTDLRDAFTGAESGGASVTAIWVAAGTYKPVESTDIEDYDDYSFELLEDVALFGHFGGVGTYETSTGQRNFADANNETILEGQIGEGDDDAVKYIITAEDISEDRYGVVDGFTIRNSHNGAGIYLDISDVAIANCKLKNNNRYGIQVKNYSHSDIHNCLFVGNSSQNINAATHCWPIVSYCTFDGNDTTSEGIGISSYTVLDVEDSIFKDHTGDGINGADGELTVTSCKFESNNDNGLELSNVTTTVTNCSIEHSSYSGIQTTNGCNLVLKGSIIRYSGGHGISLTDNTGTTILNNWIHNNGSSGLYSSNHTVNTLLVRNNTIYGNFTYGVECSEYGADPNISNCIIAGIAGNDSNDLYRVNGSFNKVNYCLLQNDHTGTGNITGDPGFMNIDIDADDLHLDENSQCKDAGDPNGDYGSETDIDGEQRIRYGRVDIGADEYYWSPADFDKSGNVDFVDYAIFAAAWQSEPNDNNYNEDCDLEDNNAIDYNDLTLFCEDWLWQAAWAEKEILLATDFESGIPAGWTVVDWLDDNKTWTTSNPEGRSSEYWTGAFCIVDSDEAGSVDMNEALITPAIDCSGAVEVTLKFSHYFQHYSSEKCDVDVSINNNPWQTILQYTGASTGGNITEDISALAADQPNVRIRWHYYDANYEYYWGIDNVKVIGNFRIPPMQMCMGDGGGSSLKSSMIMESSFLSFDTPSISIVPSAEKSSDNLMLSATESLRTRPERLVAKSQKFYNITPQAIAESKTVRPKPPTMRELYELHTELLKWLDEIWLSGELKEVMTEDEYLEFRKAVEESLQ